MLVNVVSVLALALVPRLSLGAHLESTHGFNAHRGQHGRAPFGLRTLLDVGDDVQPAPPSIGADVPLTYFGTVDEEAARITMPIYKGIVEPPSGKGNSSEMFYVVTDTTDQANAEALGLNHSPKLRYGVVGNAARRGTLRQDGLVYFNGGMVDFTPEHSVVPGADAPFPPGEGTQPGSVGDEHYSPLFVLENGGGEVYNAPIVASGATTEQLQAYCDGIDDDARAEARNLDATAEVPAALEQVTFAPALADVKVGGDDSLFSAVERIFITVNGYTNADDLPASANLTAHPSRQGLNSAILGEGAALNVLGGIPTIATDYSPLWDGNVGEWTPEAIDAGFRVRLLEEFQILGFAQNGLLTGPGGVPYGSAGFIVNCPIVFRFL